MEAKQIKEAIGRCRSQAALREIVEACRARQGELRKREQEELAHAIEQAWLSVRKSQSGHVAVVFSGAEIAMGVVDAGKRRSQGKRVRLAAGTILRVHAVQPRAKRAWLRNESSGEHYAMTPRELGLLEIRAFRDDLTAHVALAQRGLSTGGSV